MIVVPRGTWGVVYDAVESRLDGQVVCKVDTLGKLMLRNTLTIRVLRTLTHWIRNLVEGERSMHGVPYPQVF